MVAIAAISSAPASLFQFAGTSFETSPGYDADYIDTDLTAHTLVNASGPVSFGTVSVPIGGSEIGFTSSFTPNADTGTAGLAGGQELGISTQADDNGGFTDGLQGYKAENIDGLLTVTFDPVGVATYATSYVSLDIWVADTGWEDDNGNGPNGGDGLRIYNVFEDNSIMDFVNTFGLDPDDVWDTPGAPVEGEWVTLTQSISGRSTSSLVVEFQSDKGKEEVYIDNVRYLAPEPSTAFFSLLGLGLLLRRRR